MRSAPRYEMSTPIAHPVCFQVGCLSTVPGSVSVTVLPFLSPFALSSSGVTDPAALAAATAAAASLATSTGRPERFTFDRVFTPDAHQAEVYEAIGAPVLQSVLAGFNGCILAYGQVSDDRANIVRGVSTCILRDPAPLLCRRQVAKRTLSRGP